MNEELRAIRLDNELLYERLDRLAKQNEELKSRSAKLVEALKFYADESSWEVEVRIGAESAPVVIDEGAIARVTLAEHEKEGAK